MPFVAKRRGETVAPEEVPDDASLTCIDCGEELRVRASHERNGEFVARHFWHVGGGEGCSGGESDIHRRLKSIVLSKLKHVFTVADAGVEKTIGENVADVYATFEDRDEKYGQGIVFEAQYRNEGKDIESTTRNYLKEDYSVCWIEPDDIDGMDIELSEPEWFYPSKAREYVRTGKLESVYEPNFGQVEKSFVCPDCKPDIPADARSDVEIYYPYKNYKCPDCKRKYKFRGDGFDLPVELVIYENDFITEIRDFG
ncbi:MAG: hypothetical protein ACLFNI_12145 [Natronomonas sp.]